MNVLFEAIGWLLALFYSLVPSTTYGLGIAIILLTCTVMLALFPLTAKQARSMIAMQRIQPEIKKIQAKHKDDKQKQNEEILKFYQENKINPLSGCLPLIVQAPFLISLFTVLRHPEKYVPKTGRFATLFQDLCGEATKTCKNSKGLHFLSMDLSTAASKAGEVADGFVQTLPYFILVALVVGTGWFQTYQTMARQKRSGAPAPTAQAQMIGRIMPIFIGFISLNFPSGVVLYWVTSNVWRIGQQQLVLNKLYEQAANEPPPGKSGPPKDVADGKRDGGPPARRDREVSRGPDREGTPRPAGGATAPSARRKKKKRKR